MENEDRSLISDAIDKVEMITLQHVVKLLKKYPVQEVINALEAEVKEKEAKLKD